MSGITYHTIDRDCLDLIRPLWERLTAHHGERSPNFKKRYANLSFDQRREELLAAGPLRIETARDDIDRIVGYCVSSFRGGGAGVYPL